MFVGVLPHTTLVDKVASAPDLSGSVFNCLPTLYHWNSARFSIAGQVLPATTKDPEPCTLFGKRKSNTRSILQLFSEHHLPEKNGAFAATTARLLGPPDQRRETFAAALNPSGSICNTSDHF
jgi:hypothetical protein